MRKLIIAMAFLPFTSNTFASLSDLDALFPENTRTYTPAESCAKAKEAIKILTQRLSEKAEKVHSCLEDQLNRKTPTPTVCTPDSYPSLSFVQEYEELRWIDCNPKRDPAFPRKTSAYRFLEQ